MKEFLENLPVNHWSTIIVLVAIAVSLFYIIFFYFSKEGKDERGRGIFASASAITFILMLVFAITLDINADSWIVSSKVFKYINNFQLAVLFLCQSISIFVLKKIR